MTSAAPLIAQSRRIVLKIGSSLLAHGTAVRAPWLAALAEDIAEASARGIEIVIVSSGAVALGRARVGLGDGVLSLEEKQAAAAAGQPVLMKAWHDALAPHGLEVAQVLLTLEDSERRRRYLNARSTFTTLLAHRLIPVVNENDTVATAELKFGDNDRLAARVAVMVTADLMVLFSDVDGLYTDNPTRNAQAAFVPQVTALNPEILAMAQGAASARSNGGMRTKLEAAGIVMSAGCAMAIARGDTAHPLRTLLAGGKATWFHPATSPRAARKQWIGTSVEPVGVLNVDAGAAAALRQGKSLLPAGVMSVRGAFERGDTVWVCAPDGTRIAKGLAAYNAREASAICGKKSDAIAEILGYEGRSTLIHRDDLVML